MSCQQCSRVLGFCRHLLTEVNHEVPFWHKMNYRLWSENEWNHRVFFCTFLSLYHLPISNTYGRCFKIEKLMKFFFFLLAFFSPFFLSGDYVGMHEDHLVSQRNLVTKIIFNCKVHLVFPLESHFLWFRVTRSK